MDVLAALGQLEEEENKSKTTAKSKGKPQDLAAQNAAKNAGQRYYMLHSSFPPTNNLPDHLHEGYPREVPRHLADEHPQAQREPLPDPFPYHLHKARTTSVHQKPTLMHDLIGHLRKDPTRGVSHSQIHRVLVATRSGSLQGRTH